MAVHPAEAISMQGQEARMNCTVRPSDKNLSAWVLLSGEGLAY